MKQGEQTELIVKYISEHPLCTFEQVVIGTQCSRGTVKDILKKLTNEAILDIGMRARGVYQLADPPPSKKTPAATDAVPVPYQRLVQYVRRLNRAYQELKAECVVKDSRIAELERMVQDMPGTDSLMVHKEVMEP